MEVVSKFCKCPGLALRLGFVFLCLGFGSNVSGQKLRLEIEPQWQGKPLALDQALSTRHWPGLSIRRLDGLLSQLALQRADGTWLESDRWTTFFSAREPRLSAMADGLPAQEFNAIRFRVGLDAETDASDPAQWPPEHPLHPDVCGLHWGWRSGYVFLAIEGTWDKSPTHSAGFSYHLAGGSTPMVVELPVKFSAATSKTISLSLELSTLLNDGDLLGESVSTHSRAGDALATALKERVRRSFRVQRVDSDLYQPTTAAPTPMVVAARPAGTTPYPLRISERLPKITLPPDNPLTMEGVALGNRLFHETRLSRNDRQSCASCHDRSRGFAEGRRASVGTEGQPGRRNAMALANLAWGREMFWDGRAASIRQQVLLPIQDAHEMNETLDRVVAKLNAAPEYAEQFRRAFGTGDISPQRVALALEQFLLTLVSQESRFDRAARGLITLTAQEQRGLKLFVTESDPARGLRGADCFHCHGGNLFSNHQFMNNGLPEVAGDLGRVEVTGKETDRGKFKVPSLRNIALTAPYMHDGRFTTLEQVVDHYDSGVRRSKTLDPNLAKHPDSGLGLSPEDKAALVAFLKTLTDEEFVSQPPHVTTNQLSKAY